MTITLTREEAQQVLYALADAAWCVQHNNLPPDDGHDWDKEIELLRARLAEPYRQQADAVFAETNGRMRIDPVTGDVGIGLVSEPELKVVSTGVTHIYSTGAPVAQPEPEPVAWMMLENKLVPIHTAPPQREWQGLTETEIMEMLDYGQYGNVPQYARNFVDAIEAKLKEKNA